MSIDGIKKQWLVVDLDDTFLKTDCLYEHFLLLVKTNPYKLLFFPFWLLKGRLFLKNQISLHVKSIENLPVRNEIIELIKAYKNKKYCILLASASPQKWVQTYFDMHADLFDSYISSTQENNLKGHKKLKNIRNFINDSDFIYIGDSSADLPIWQAASKAIVVNPNEKLRRQIKKLNQPIEIINDKNNIFPLLIKQMRPHQWMKNILIFLPAISAHLLYSYELILKCLIGMIGFSLAASFVYVLNDLMDLSSDRTHYVKKNRPFASGNLSLKYGLLLLPTLLTGSFAISSLLNSSYVAWVVCYITLNLLYSFVFKKTLGLDIILLSIMYTIRIYAGGAATSIPVSEWLLNFSTLFFFSLACVKRATELMRSQNKLSLDGRGYRRIDLQAIQILGAGAGMLSILVILLYLQSSAVRALYKSPQLLWLLTPLLLYWIVRVWLLAHRDEIDDDPVIFAIKDKVSWIIGFLILIVVGIAA